MAALGFTPASGQDVFSLEFRPPGTQTSCSLSGQQARLFYESLTTDGEERRGSGSVCGEKDAAGEVRPRVGRPGGTERRRGGAAVAQRSRADPAAAQSGGREAHHREAGSSRTSSVLQGLKLLRCAHEGDIPGLKDLLSKGVDINFQDSFFWTAVMCASWSGQRAAVRLLLQHGAAWVGVVDTQGRDAKDLAREAGNCEVLEELMNFGRSSPREKQSDSSCLQPQWCEVCRSEHSGSLSSHLSSTLHQFSLRRPPAAPYYCLPPSSNSYRMMVRCGWKPGTGLGPEGEGPQQPVRTVLKRDQAGLGYGEAKRAKVTHFQARDCDAVKRPSREKEERRAKRQTKEERKRKEAREKNWERDFRSSFYL